MIATARRVTDRLKSPARYIAIVMVLGTVVFVSEWIGSVATAVSAIAERNDSGVMISKCDQQMKVSMYVENIDTTSGKCQLMALKEADAKLSQAILELEIKSNVQDAAVRP